MMYIPLQVDVTMFDEMKALDCGTLFTVLNKPFAGKCCK
ncbi:MAG: spore coat associated protein CotJA [Clostridia bacterium]|nr:spore coat associated protein CotJA [Clostridia bacterium]